MPADSFDCIDASTFMPDLIEPGNGDWGAWDAGWSRKEARAAGRMIYNFYIFDRKGACLFYREWSRPLNTLAGDPQEERKLMFGMLYSIKGLVAALGSKNAPSSEGLNHLRTNAYTLHHYETPTGLRFVLNTDNAMASDMRPHLRHIYAGIWVEHVVKHPQYRIGQGSQLPPLFAEKLEDYITGLAVFR